MTIQITLSQLFENNFDCYTSRLENDGGWTDDIPAMTKEKFIEIVSKLKEVKNDVTNDKTGGMDAGAKELMDEWLSNDKPLSNDIGDAPLKDSATIEQK
jgi:hypothetical protein